MPVLRRSSFAFSTGCEMLRSPRFAKAVRNVPMATRKRKQPARRRRTTRKRRATRCSWWKPLTAMVVLAALVVLGYSVYLGKTVRVKFDGQRWAAPAQIFARPLDLYAGAAISAAQLKAELRFLGYREVAKVSGPAQWAQSGERFAIHIRDFTFWDGREAGQSVLVDIRGGSVARIRGERGGAEIDLLRLEPALVGSIYPAHNEDRVLVKREDLPDHLVNGLLAVEDRRFFEHSGVDL